MKSLLLTTLPTSTSKKRARSGLTLIELIVVLVILVGLGGLLVPVISNALTQTHVATCAQNFPEITNALLRMETTKGHYGDGWDTAVDENSVHVNGLSVGTLTADEVIALNEVGIANVFNHNTAAPNYNITFNPGYVPATLDTSTNVVVLTPAQAAAISLPATGTEKYVSDSDEQATNLVGHAG